VNENSPNLCIFLNLTIDIFLNELPLWMKTRIRLKQRGIMDALLNKKIGFFFNFLNDLCFLFFKTKIYLNIISGKFESFHLDLAISYYLLNLAILPQGVTSGELVFVLPPWGWSTGFIATPLTVGLIPFFLFSPALPTTVL